MTHRTHPQQRLVSTLRVSTRKKGSRWIGNSKTKQFLRNAPFRLAARHKGNKTPMKHSMIQHRESEIFKYLSSHLFPAVTQIGQWHDFWRACSLFAVRLAWFERSVSASDATRDTNKLYARKKSCSCINQCLSFAHFGGWLAASFIQNKGKLCCQSLFDSVAAWCSLIQIPTFTLNHHRVSSSSVVRASVIDPRRVVGSSPIWGFWVSGGFICNTLYLIVCHYHYNCVNNKILRYDWLLKDLISIGNRLDTMGLLQLSNHVVQNRHTVQIWWLSLTCPSASFALQYGDFVPRDCSAVKGPFRELSGDWFQIRQARSARPIWNYEHEYPWIVRHEVLLPINSVKNKMRENKI